VGVEGFRLLLLDLKAKADEYAYQIAHGIPTSTKDDREQMLFRGKIAAYEDFLELKDDLEEWKKVLKGQ